MPFYDFRCDCGNEFNVMARMSQLEDKSIECPDCGSNDLHRVYGSVNVISSASRKEFECPNAHLCGAHCRH
ncbi:MAG: zinc ribbon domain-containing protein [Oscillospiraceae bacterium]|nr:zinc ribbon domain-containing protein [Oscillospiraceae bacterium]